MKTATALIGTGIALVGVWLLVRGAKGACMSLAPGSFYYLTYTGGRKTVRKALGECYSVIYTIDIYDSETDDWIAPIPETDILETGAVCRVMVQEPCTLCGFRSI